MVLAAFLHAFWNAVVKGGNDKLAAMVAVVVGHALPALAVLPFVPAPDPASYPWLGAGIALHLGYQLLLARAYERADLTAVYPIARGSAPLLVALVSVVFLGAALSARELVATLVIAAGVGSVCLVRSGMPGSGMAGARLALLAGAFIAAYSLVDGLGARLAGTALGFYAWLALGNAAAMLALAPLLRPGVLGDVRRRCRTVLVVGGFASFGAYALVIWSFTQAPIALVTALRETSIVFALLIGVLHLKERLDLVKVFATATTLLGAAMLRFAH